MAENQRIVLTKRLLKEGLVRLLKVKPLDKISVSELCKEAGINRATFYRHYEVTRDVLFDMHLDLIAELKLRSNRPVSNANLDLYMEEMFNFLLEHKALIKLIIEYLPDVDIPDTFNTLYQRALSESRIGPELPKFDEESRRLIHAYYAGANFYFIRTLIMEDIQKTPKEIATIRRFLYNAKLKDDA